MKRCNDCNNTFDGSSCPTCGSNNVEEVYNNTSTHTESAGIGPAAEAGDANPILDAVQREYLLAAATHRSRLQKSDDESLLVIADRLRTQVEAARAADAARRRPEATFDAAGHRPGWRLTDDAWRHDRRRKQSTTHEFDPAGREANTYVTTEEDDEEDGKRNGKTEEAISDCYK